MQQLHFRPGDASSGQLLAPGLPELIHVAPSGAIAHALGQALAVQWTPEHLAIYDTGPLASLRVDERGWIATSTAGSVHRIEATTAHSEPVPGRLHRAGWAATITRGMGEWNYHPRARDLPAGARALPGGAREAGPELSPCGEHLAWVSMGFLYVQGPDLRVHARAPVTAAQLAVGPGGGLVLVHQGHLWAAAPRSHLQRLPHSPRLPLDARFDADGTSVLVALEDGVVCLHLDGTAPAVAEGALQPLGFGPGPTVLDEEAGRVCALAGTPCGPAMVPAAPACQGRWLAGPGGACWDLDAGRSRWTNDALIGAELAVVGDLIVVIADTRVLCLDALTGRLQSEWTLPTEALTDGEADFLGVAEGLLWFDRDDHCVGLGMQGAPVALCDVPPVPEPTLADPEWLGLYGGVVRGGRRWLWSDDGALLCLSP